MAMVAAPIAFFWYVGGFGTVTGVFMCRYQRFVNLNRLVSVKHKGMAAILYVSVYLLFQALIYSTIQKFNKTVKKKRNHYEITYFLGGQKYMFTAPLRKGPSSVILVIGDDDIDITDLVMPYMGPREDFHGQEYTPEFFGQKTVIFEMDDSTQKVFRDGEKIFIKNDLEMKELS